MVLYTYKLQCKLYTYLKPFATKVICNSFLILTQSIIIANTHNIMHYMKVPKAKGVLRLPIYCAMCDIRVKTNILKHGKTTYYFVILKSKSR